jgi:lathosterol oxidase
MFSNNNTLDIIYFAIFILVTHGLRTIVMSGGVYWFLYILKKDKYVHRKINPKTPNPNIVKLEMKYSLLFTFYFVFWDTIAYYFFQNGQTVIYTDVNMYGLWYLPVSYFLLLAAHDTYFYWTHRLAHSKYGKWINHSIHHKSHNPTPWGGFSMSVVEGNVQTLFQLIVVFIVPLHPYVMIYYFFHSYFSNVLIGHSGYEFIGIKSPKFINNGKKHNDHHRYNQGNFSLFFQFWDRVMGTSFTPENH